MKTLNLTQHIGTVEQQVVEPLDKQAVQDLLTFDSLPAREEIDDRAWRLSVIAARQCETGDRVMIGGAPFLMSGLESRLKACRLVPVYAFSRREVEEQRQPDGSVKKVAVFRHVGFVEA